MSPFGFHRKDRLAQEPLSDALAGEALVVEGDPGYSAMSWWTARVRLQLRVPGHDPFFVVHDGNAVREKPPLTGLVLPVDVERADPTQVRIRWDEVPTVQERIAAGDQFILDPEQAWEAVVAADPEQGARRPAFGDGTLPGWPPSEPLKHGRQPATALVVAHSWDPAGSFSGGDFLAPGRKSYSSGGTIETGLHSYLGWLLLCVLGADGRRWGVTLQTKVRRGRLGPVLPVALDPAHPDDVDIQWDAAPEVAVEQAGSSPLQLAEQMARGEAKIASDPEVADDVLSQIDNPLARRAAGRLLRKSGGAVIVTSSGPGSAAPADPAAVLESLQKLRDSGALNEEAYEAERAKLFPEGAGGS